MWAMRWVMTRVLPVPAPARIKTGPSRVCTARRCCGFNESTFDMRNECRKWVGPKTMNLRRDRVRSRADSRMRQIRGGDVLWVLALCLPFWTHWLPESSGAIPPLSDQGAPHAGGVLEIA